MTYAAYDLDDELGRPAILVAFDVDGTVSRYTPGPANLSKAAQTWTFVPGFSPPDAVSTTARPEQEETIFTFPRSNAFALARLSHAATRTAVEIYRTHLSDPDEEVQLRWTGYIERAVLRGETIELVCYQGRQGMEDFGAYRRSERTCPYALYSTPCGVAIGSFQAARTATATSGATVTINSSVSNEAQHANGLMTWNGRDFNIRSVSGTTLTLDRADPAFTAAVASSGSESISIAPGCAKNLTSCAFFANEINFGGFPYMRDRELFAGRSAV